MNPKWPAIRDELESAMAAAMAQDDVRAWILWVRKRVKLGGEVDPLPYVEVTKHFFELLRGCADPSVSCFMPAKVVGIPIEVL